MRNARVRGKTSGRAEVFGFEIDPVDRGEAVRNVIELATTPGFSVVVTANLDHAVRVRRNHELRRLYDRAEIVLADGFPLVLASRLRGRGLPDRVTGADLILPLCLEASRRQLSVFVVGSTLRILSKACRKLRSQYPQLTIAGVYAPSFGFHPGHAESAQIVQMLDWVRPDIVFVALGSPKQEIWADAHRGVVAGGVFVCIGAGFDYLAGQPPRAPQLVQRLCLEWLWRLAHDPRRLAKRYAINLLYLPLLLIEHLGWAASRPAPETLPSVPRSKTGWAD